MTDTPPPEFKLDPSIKTKWLAGLRHGGFTQRRYCIGHKSCLCCIGVGAAVLGKFDPNSFDFTYTTYDAARDLGLSAEARDYLIDLNDKHEWTFAQIADEIEAHF